MQQWPAIRPRCHSDPVDSTSLISSFGDYDGFESSASETLWQDNMDNRGGAGSCMYTALSQAMAVSSSCHELHDQQRLCENISSSSSSPPPTSSYISSSPPSYVSSSPPIKTSPGANNFKYTSNNIIHTTLTGVFKSDEQSDCDALLRSSPDSIYGTSPGLPDTTVIDHAGSPGSRDPNTGLARPKRRPYSKLQLMHLEQEFQQSMYPCRERRAWLSQILSLSERQVKIWFQNRRTKLKRSVEREKKEHEQMQRDMATLAMQFYAPPPQQQPMTTQQHQQL